MILSYSKQSGNPVKGHVDRLLKELENLKDGNYVIKIEPNDIVGNPRGRYFAILKVISQQVGMTSNELHDEYKKQFNGGKSTNLFKSNKEWGQYIDKVAHHARTFHEVTIPDPQAVTYQEWMEIDEQYNSQFNFN